MPNSAENYIYDEAYSLNEALEYINNLNQELKPLLKDALNKSLSGEADEVTRKNGIVSIDCIFFLDLLKGTLTQENIQKNGDTLIAQKVENGKLEITTFKFTNNGFIAIYESKENDLILSTHSLQLISNENNEYKIDWHDSTNTISPDSSITLKKSL